jgi:hypothetical protein
VTNGSFKTLKMTLPTELPFLTQYYDGFYATSAVSDNSGEIIGGKSSLALSKGALAKTGEIVFGHGLVDAQQAAVTGIGVSLSNGLLPKRFRQRGLCAYVEGFDSVPTPCTAKGRCRILAEFHGWELTILHDASPSPGLSAQAICDATKAVLKRYVTSVDDLGLK